MSYEDQKARLRVQLEEEYIQVKNLDSHFLDLVTEKIMAEGFNKEFYRGVGSTTTTISGPLIRLNFRTKCKALLRGFGVTFFAIVQIIKTRRNASSSIPIGLIYAVPERHYASHLHRDKLKGFLDSTIIQSGIEAPSRYLLQSGTLRRFKENANIEVVTHIGSKILSSWSPNKTKTLCEIVGRTFTWLKISRKYSSFLLVGGEYVVDSLAIEIMKEQKKFVLITTQSQLLAPPLLFKSKIHASRIMYWYSDNSIQITRKESKPRDYSYLSQEDIDTHFVWTNSWARVLFKYNQSSMIIPIGPVLFEPLKTKKVISKAPRTNPKNILIFDVTPKEAADPLSYYSERRMTSFISDIVEAVLDISPNSNIRLKPKRKYSNSDSAEYRNYLESKRNLIEQLRFDSDLTREILNSDLVICVPFTSPGLVATHLGIPTIYYSSSQEYDLSHESIRVISGRESLKKFLLQEISDLA